MTATVETMRRERNLRLQRERKRRYIELTANGVEWSRVPAEPIRKHLIALERLGWSLNTVSRWYGVGTLQALFGIREGHSLTVERKFANITTLPLTYRVDPVIPDESWVPAAGAMRRAQALMALGWTHADIREHTDGFDAMRIVRGRRRTITAKNWRRMDQAYRTLSGKRGPSDLTRSRALSAGYAPAAAWDDIDNPWERPKGVVR